MPYPQTLDCYQASRGGGGGGHIRNKVFAVNFWEKILQGTIISRLKFIFNTLKEVPRWVGNEWRSV